MSWLLQLKSSTCIKFCWGWIIWIISKFQYLLKCLNYLHFTFLFLILTQVRFLAPLSTAYLVRFCDPNTSKPYGCLATESHDCAMSVTLLWVLVQALSLVVFTCLLTRSIPWGMTLWSVCGSGCCSDLTRFRQIVLWSYCEITIKGMDKSKIFTESWIICLWEISAWEIYICCNFLQRYDFFAILTGPSVWVLGLLFC